MVPSLLERFPYALHRQGKLKAPQEIALEHKRLSILRNYVMVPISHKEWSFKSTDHPQGRRINVIGKQPRESFDVNTEGEELGSFFFC